MAYNDQNGNTVLATVNPITFNVNRTNLQSNVSVTGFTDTVWTPWGGLIGAQVGLPYDTFKSNSYVNLYARHMGGWAQVNLGSDLSNDVYDTVALQRTGDWVLNLGGADKVIGGAGAGTNANLYITSNANINTDGSLASIHAGSGVQNVTIESGLTGSQTWIRQKDEYTGMFANGVRYDSWTVSSADAAFIGSDANYGSGSDNINSAAHDNREQNTGVGLTQNAAGDVNNASTVSLGEGTDSLFLLNNTRMVTDFWWESFWIFGGKWHGYTYSENAWTMYWTGSNWNAYNNFKDYTVSVSTDVESIYFTYVNDDGSIDYQVLSGGSNTVNHYSGGFPGSGGTTNGNPINPLSLGVSGFVPSTDTGNGSTANIQIVASKGSLVSFHSDSGYHNEYDNPVNQTTLSGLTTMSGGAQTIAFAARDAGTDANGAELGTIRLNMGASYGDSQYYLYLGTNGSGDAADLSGASMKVVAYGFNSNDNIIGSAFADTLVGGDGHDSLTGGLGVDKIYGNTGNDTLVGGEGLNFLDGGAGNDVQYGDSNNSQGDTLFGGLGNDTITGGLGDFVKGGDGNDAMYAANTDATTGTTYFIDNEGNNTITTNGNFDAVYFSNDNKGNYTNTINNGGAEVVTMLLEHRSTTRSANDTNFTNTDTPISAFVYIPDSQNFSVNATSAGNADVINFYGGDRYDTSFVDHTVNTVLFGTWFQWRSYGTVNGQRDNDGSNFTVNANNRFGTLNSPSLVMDWASDGQMYYGHTDGILAPLHPETAAYRIDSAVTFEVNTVGYKGYFTFYNPLSSNSTIFYVNAGLDKFIDEGEMTYLGVMNGQAGGSVKYGSFVNGEFSLGSTTAQVQPLSIVDGIDLASADDTAIVGVTTDEDNQTSQTSGLTLTATVQAGVALGDVRVYDWIDADSDGVIDTGEKTLLTVSSGSVVGTTFQGDISLSYGTHKIVISQTVGAQTSELDPSAALTIRVVADLAPPVIDSIVTTSTALNVTVHDGFVDVGNFVNARLANGSTTIDSANNLAYAGDTGTLTVAAQASVVQASVTATDAAGNLEVSGTSVWLGTTNNDSITGGSTTDIIYGFAGNDTLLGGGDTDTVYGGSGNDSITGGTGNDSIDGGDGNDYLDGAQGNDTLTGGAGNDVFRSDAGTTTVSDFGSGGGDGLEVGGTGIINATLVAANTLPIGAVSFGSINVSTVSGTQLAAGSVVNFAALGGSAGINLNLSTQTANAVSVVGSNAADTITGGAGNDTITGGAGADTIVGGLGADVYTYTSTADTATSNTPSQMDVLDGFVIGTDTINISALGAATMGTPTRGTWNGTAFTAGAGDDWIVSWTTGGTTNYVLLKDTGETNYLNVSNSGGVLSFTNTPPASLTYLAWDPMNLGLITNDTNGNPPSNVRDLFYFDLGITVSGTEYLNSLIPTIGGISNNAFVQGNLDNSAGVIWSVSHAGGSFVDQTYGENWDNSNNRLDNSVSQSPGPGQYMIQLNSQASFFSVNKSLFSTTAADNYIFRATYNGISLDLGIYLGSSAAESISAGTANDMIIGRDGLDSISGGDGNDILIAGDLSDTTLSTAAAASTLDGGTGNDYILGGNGGDSLVGWIGNDTIIGGVGNDSINGGDNNDSILGGVGNDSIYGDDGNDTIDGGADNDTIIAGVGNDSVAGGTGNDSIDGAQGNDTIDGGLGNDTISGGDGVDSLVGGGGTDTALYSTFTETATGASQPATSIMDRLVGFSAGDIVDFTSIGVTSVTISLDPNGSGDDYVMSWTDGTDTGYTYLADTGNTTGLTGSLTGSLYTIADAASLNATNFGLIGSTFGVTLGTTGLINYIREGTQSVRQQSVASSTTPTLTLEPASSGYDLGFLQAQDAGGNSRIRIPDTNTFVLRGSNASNTLDVSAINTSDLTASEVTNLQRMYVFGFDGNDSILGTTVTDYIDGGAGNDTLSGGNGIDTLVGGDGVDSMTGGAANDVFVYTAITQTATATDYTTSTDISTLDVLNGFILGQDTIDISAISTTPTVNAPVQGTVSGTTFAAGAGDDWVVSWTVGADTNYVLLKDTTASYMDITNTAGVLSFSASPTIAIDQFSLTAPNQLTISADKVFTVYVYSGSNPTVGTLATYTSSSTTAASNVTLSLTERATLFKGKIAVAATGFESTVFDARSLIIGTTGSDTLTYVGDTGKGSVFFGGAGADALVVVGDATVDITAGEYWSWLDFNGSQGDYLDLGNGSIRPNTSQSVSGLIANAIDITATVASGKLTLSGTDASMVDTLPEWVSIATSLTSSSQSLFFDYAGSTWVHQHQSPDTLIELMGASGYTSMSNTSGSVSATNIRVDF